MSPWLPIEKRLNTFILVSCLLVMGYSSFGCAPKTRGFLNEDIASLLKENTQVTLYEPQYRMVAKSNIGICEFKAFPQEIDSIANAFDMTEIQPGSKTLQYIKYDGKDSNLGELFLQDNKDIKAFGVFGHPTKLKCKNGNAFEYMILFYKPKTKETSLETCYCSTE